MKPQSDPDPRGSGLQLRSGLEVLHKHLHAFHGRAQAERAQQRASCEHVHDGGGPEGQQVQAPVAEAPPLPEGGGVLCWDAVLGRPARVRLIPLVVWRIDGVNLVAACRETTRHHRARALHPTCTPRAPGPTEEDPEEEEQDGDGPQGPGDASRSCRAEQLQPREEEHQQQNPDPKNQDVDGEERGGRTLE